MLLPRPPSVRLPGASATTDGPMLNLPCPRMVFVVVEIVDAVPAPQVSLPGLRGEWKNMGTMSPSPYSPPVF